VFIERAKSDPINLSENLRDQREKINFLQISLIIAEKNIRKKQTN